MIFFKHDWPRTLLIAAFAVVHLLLCYFGHSPFGPSESVENLWVTVFFALALFFPFLSLSGVFCSWLSVILILNFLNYLKLEYLQRQISEYDFRIIFSSPSYSLDALLGYGPNRYLPLILLLLFFVFLAVKFRKFSRVIDVKKLFYKLSSAALALSIFFAHYFSYQISLEQSSEKNLDPLGMIAYTGSKAYLRDVKSLLKKDEKEEIVGQEKIKISAKKYLTNVKKNIKPNIVFVLAESTFDPNKIFILKSPYRENSLFRADKRRYYGDLEVSITGGGTWVTEFETNSGISTKALGTSDHINTAIAPHLKTSFARYLQQKNYTASVFFPITRAYVNKGETYLKSYGFDSLEDSESLDMSAVRIRDGYDVEMVRQVIKKLPKGNKNPFFSYVILLENHGPHECRKNSLNPYQYRLLNDDDFRKNCEVEEYLARAKSSDLAIKNLENELRKIEREQHRPFLMVIFGDHQPWTFNKNNYDKNRVKGSSRYSTFYKIIASDSLPTLKIPKKISPNLLPTIVSSIFATRVEDLYVPENYYLFEKCGVVSSFEDCLAKLKSRRLDYDKYFGF